MLSTSCSRDEFSAEPLQTMKLDDDPFELFGRWFEDAKKSETTMPDAVALATATANGVPSVRMVLLKGFDVSGFVFYTNLGSRKGGELAQSPHAAMCFHWKTLQRQVRIEGRVLAVSEEEADAYFASRERSSQIGAWASQQSQPLEGRYGLEKAVAKYVAKFLVGGVERPPFWSGFRIAPERLEFWQEGAFRLHDRMEFRATSGVWAGQYLYP